MNESTVNPSVMPAAVPTQGSNHGGLPVTPPRHEGHPTAPVTPAARHRLGQTPDTDGTDEDLIATNSVETAETLDEDTFGADISDGAEAVDPGTMGHESAGREDSLRYSALHEPAMMLTVADATFIASDPAPLALAQPMEYLGSAVASGSSDASVAAGSTVMGELMPMLGAVAFGVVAATSMNNATQPPNTNSSLSPTATGTTPPLVFSISHAAGAPHVMVVDVTLPSTMVAGQTLTFSVAQSGTALETVNYVLTQADINAGSITKFLGSNNLTDNTYQISVNQAGTTALASNTSSFHLDVTAPSAPQLNLSPNGNGTTVNVSLPIDAVVGDSLTLTLRDQTGSTVQTVTQAVTALNLSTHTLQLSLNTGTLPPNTTYQALASLTDAAGNTSSFSTPAALTTPGAPTPGITLSQDSGTVGDHITNQAGISLSGILTGAIVEYSLNGGAWSASYTAPTQNGSYTLQVRQIDTSTGHVSNPGTLSFTLDTVAPAALGLALANGANGLTNSAALAALTPEVGALVEYRVDGGAWASSYTAPTANAAHTVDVRQTDAAGNVSPTASLSFTLDTVAPAALGLALANGANG
ncbi:Ig-like domain repeat protein, partial [Leptothrix ochracea]|uniref:Ig-like domain repeat protein n=2 Tax=Leptothrix ochracea TaxID=735331 RepID=UPI0034E2BE3F